MVAFVSLFQQDTSHPWSDNNHAGRKKEHTWHSRSTEHTEHGLEVRGLQWTEGQGQGKSTGAAEEKNSKTLVQTAGRLVSSVGGLKEPCMSRSWPSVHDICCADSPVPQVPCNVTTDRWRA